MLLLESGLIIWEIIAFGLLIIVPRAFAWQPLVVVLNNRTASIRQSIENAEQAQREAFELLQRSRNVLLQSEKEIEHSRSRARELSNQLTTMMAEVAEKAVEQILNENREQIQYLKQQAIRRLQAEIGGLAVECAAIIIDNALDDQKHKELVNRALRSIPLDGKRTSDEKSH